MNTCDSDPTLRPTPVVDADHPAVLAFTHHAISGVTGTREQAVALYYAVRDGIRYDPYHIHLTVAGTCASGVLAAGRGWCVNKAALLAACCRAAGIPARLGYADVRNHLSTERLRRNLGTDTFYWHGYTVILIDGRWVKATPAFNVELCEKFRLATLEFNGHEDSLYHPFDLDGRRHMEYLRYHDEYDDVPLDSIRADFDRHYPNAAQLLYADFDADVNRETAR